ncbi:T9SS type A sorting domain-containing protein [Nubsella zeaxanthinifaciens]|uniref:T9SS type A sorting domain-containing protein n=1 Tax=Nubsella zeaxanthinifaciens TaxID=392412 RepID=UPI003CFF1889
MKKLLLLFSILSTYVTVWSQTSAEVLTSTNTTTNYRAPRGDFGSSRGAYYLSAAEITAAGIPVNAVLASIGYRYSLAPTVAATGTMKIYLQNTTDNYYNKSSSTWTTVISDMTLVKNESTSIPAASAAKYSFQNNFRWNGGGIYVAIEFVNSASTPDAGGAATIRTNSGTFVDESNTSVVTIRYSTSATATLPTSIATTSSSSRPLTTFEYFTPTANDLSVAAVYALGQKPIGANGTEAISAVVENVGGATVTNRNVTLSVTGSNSFSSTKQVTVSPGALVNVVFDDFVASTIGSNNISVSVDADDNAVNNSKSSMQTTNDGILSHINIGTAATGNLSAGSSGGVFNAMFLIKHKVFGNTKINAVNISIGNSSTLDLPSVPTKIYAVILSADGTTTLGRSDDYVIVPAQDKGAKKTFMLQTPVPVNNQEFLIGMAYDAGEQIFPIRYLAESPLRPNTSYRKVGGHADALPLLANTSGIVFLEAVLETSSTLPVNIKTFNAKLNNGKVNLTWTVGTETNVNHYEVERSANGKDFIKVATVTALGAANYSASDASPLIGINYYRLKGVDNDGTLSLFDELRSVKLTTLENSNVVVYPNPLAGNTINVSLSNYAGGDYKYKLLDAIGKVVQQGTINNNGSETSAITVSNSLNKGIYLLQLVAGDQVIQSKLVKR